MAIGVVKKKGEYLRIDVYGESGRCDSDALTEVSDRSPRDSLVGVGVGLSGLSRTLGRIVL